MESGWDMSTRVSPARTRKVWVHTHELSPTGAVVKMIWKSISYRTNASRGFQWAGRSSIARAVKRREWSTSPSPLSRNNYGLVHPSSPEPRLRLAGWLGTTQESSKHESRVVLKTRAVTGLEQERCKVETISTVPVLAW